MHELHRPLALAVLRKDWRAFGLMPWEYHFDKELMQCAVDTNWRALDFLYDKPVPEDLDSDDDTDDMKLARKRPAYWADDDIVLSAVKQDWHAMLQVDERMWESSEIVIAAIRSFYRTIPQK